MTKQMNVGIEYKVTLGRPALVPVINGVTSLSLLKINRGCRERESNVHCMHI